MKITYRRPRGTATTGHRHREPRGPEQLTLSALTAADTAMAGLQPGTATWSGPIVLENVMTGDGRIIEKNGLRWATLPIPLRVTMEDVGEHGGAQVVGRILTLTRKGNQIIGTGDFDTSSDIGQEAARLVGESIKNGISVDLDEVSFEIRVAKDALDEMSDLLVEPDDGPAQEPETDADGRVTVIEMNADDEVMVTTDARIRAATLVDIPAFEEARITLDDAPADTPSSDNSSDSTTGTLPNGDPCSCDESEPDFDADCQCDDDDSGGDDSGSGDAPAPAPFPPAKNAVVASAIPVEPPVAWFTDPHLAEPTPLSVTADGRVFGHLAVWNSCHTAFQGQCVAPPHSESDYAYFRTGSVITAEGSEIPVGHLTLDTLHAGKAKNATDTIAHYEHTGRVAADVTAGEDEHGIWVAGSLRPTLTDDQIRAFRASPLSGDWRRIGGKLELVAALAVNVPGFPIPRPQGLVASGVTTALVASGMLPPRKVIRPGTPGALSEDDLRYLKALADRERREEAARSGGLEDSAARLARRVRAVQLARRVRG